MTRVGLMQLTVFCGLLLSSTPIHAKPDPFVRIVPEGSTLAAPQSCMVGACAGFRIPQNSALHADRLTSQAFEHALTSWVATNTFAYASIITNAAGTETRYTFRHHGKAPAGPTLTLLPLRQDLSFTCQISCNQSKKRTRLTLALQSADEREQEPLVRTLTLPKSDQTVTRSVSFKPDRSGPHTLTLLLEPDDELTMTTCSFLPEDAETTWDRIALDALEMAALPALYWPVQETNAPFNWYNTVGPQTSRMERGFGFGTVEAARLAHLIHAPLIIQVPVFIAQDVPWATDAVIPITAPQLAADWVAYCNATDDHPLARLRERHGISTPLAIKQWQLFPTGGLITNLSVYTDLAARMAAAMWAEDSTITITTPTQPATNLPIRNTYVTHLLTRLEGASINERDYFQPWYQALGQCCGVMETAQTPEPRHMIALEDLVQAGFFARQMLSGAGWTLTLLNRYPLVRHLIIKTAPPQLNETPLNIEAGWSSALPGLQLFICNPGPTPAHLCFDLTALNRHFAFYIQDQVIADISAPRTTSCLPIRQNQRAGVALTQFVACEIAPSAFARILVKEASATK